MLRSTYDDGSVMSRKDIGDELLTLLAAGHETTASTLAWAFERVTRHPDLLASLVEGDVSDVQCRLGTGKHLFRGIERIPGTRPGGWLRT